MEKETKHPPHRLPDYTPELRDKICALLATGMTLRAVCRLDNIPDRQTIYNWITSNIGEVKNENGDVIEEGFFDHYSRAREVGLDEVADETVEIADDGTNDFIEIEMKKGGKKIVYDKEAVQRSKLRVDARQWYLQNMAPRKYGKNIEVRQQQLNKDGEKTDPVSQSTEILGGALAAILEAKEKAKKLNEE